jgi:TrmH family RNA methyltransferase
MISKAKVKYIKSLQVKKYRLQEQCFVSEGAKTLIEVMQSDYEVVWVAATAEFIQENIDLLKKMGAEIIETTEEVLANLGTFQSNNAAIGIVRMKPDTPIGFDEGELGLVLDDIRDPGNLGTIIRTADWFNINKVIASPSTVDFYNPKVLSATMGSFCRVRVHYTDLKEYLTVVRKPIYGTFLNGMDVHKLTFSSGGLIVIGNESNGISPQVEKLVSQKITIPAYGKAESLNAAIATGIILDVAVRSQQ